jgi:hypothetical protein
METIDNILREMRDFADRQEKNGYYDLREMSTDSLRACADLIEAAVKNQFRDTTKTMPHLREVTKMEEVAVAENATTTPTRDKSSRVGNAAKMREALEEISNLADAIYTHNECANENSLAIFSICDAALSDPPRNC